jgi:hypothetical protein
LKCKSNEIIGVFLLRLINTSIILLIAFAFF